LYAAAAGKPVNVNDLNTFPPNSHWTITYPSSGDSTLDAQNTDSFAKFDLIRLPTELGGNSKTAADFVAFSKICVHLWCSPNYGGSSNQNPPLEHRQYECPCHGSLYSVGEPVPVGGKKVKPPVGLAIAGPAQIQPPPANAIPLLTLTTDSNGILYAEVDGGVWDVNHNGVLGLGRYVPTG
jgi:rieske iron-sulfur protein